MLTKRSEFPLRPTTTALVLMAALCLTAIWLGWTGWNAWTGFHPLDPARWWFSMPPLLLALLAVGCLGYILMRFCRGKVRMDPGGVHSQGHSFSWQNLQIRSLGKGVRKRLQLSHRDQSMCLDLYALFLPHLRDLEEALYFHKRQAQTEHERVLLID